ncbi:MAG: hypothetical protein ACJ8M1_02925 [Chthoniobacterales bacterium]
MATQPASSSNPEKPSSSGRGVDWQSEEAHWREAHGNQPYADKDRSYDDYATAYRVGAEGAGKYQGRSYDEVEQNLATDYAHADPGSAIPWDTVRPAVRAAWDRLSGVISPRDSDRGVRGSI